MGTIPLGEDILLARHGSNIVKFRQNRKHRETVAFLRGGDIDTAPNTVNAVPVAARSISQIESAYPAAQVPESPAASISRGAARYLNNESAISRQEVRSLAKISLGFSALMGTIFGGLLLALYKVGGPEAFDSIATMSTMQ
ncbi:hypothetical protein [Glutamicibacter sp. NPDC087344]|uniref:hypothetical protein n=1 Tax=Glutamicibacter sp. NPDC087344 TaxID=3363994 RepID=UPI00382EC3D8